MKKITYSLLLFVGLAFVYSCKDEALDPLQVNTVKKGKVLALRGQQLQSIYFDGKPGAEVFPKIATGLEKFSFDAEYLAEDPKSLQSVDIFLNKKTSASAVPTKVLIKTVPFSDFKNDGKYPHPWVSVTLTFPEILAKLGLNNTFPLDAPTISTLLSTYKNGIGIVSDLNLTDGSKSPASNVVAAGLFASSQFYPAQILNYAMTDYCSYVASSWSGGWVGTEVGSCCSGDDSFTFTQDSVDPNKFTFDNFWGDGPAATGYIVFSPSTNPSTQTVSFPDQTTGEGGVISKSTGTYDQCKQTFTINTTYKYTNGSTYNWLYVFNRP